MDKLDYDMERQKALGNLEKLRLKIFHNECESALDLNSLSEDLDVMNNKY